MDPAKFDELTKRLAAGGVSRRGVLRGLGAGLLAALGGGAAAGAAACAGVGQSCRATPCCGPSGGELACQGRTCCLRSGALYNGAASPGEPCAVCCSGACAAAPSPGGPGQYYRCGATPPPTTTTTTAAPPTTTSTTTSTTSTTTTTPAPTTTTSTSTSTTAPPTTTTTTTAAPTTTSTTTTTAPPCTADGDTCSLNTDYCTGSSCCSGSSGEVCVSTSTDVNNCGGCGTVCSATLSDTCANGTCVCGSTGAACPFGDRCLSGACVSATTCPPGGCGANQGCCYGYCRDFSTDIHNCGGCQVYCPVTADTCVGGTCVCGSTGAACPTGHYCQSGACVAAATTCSAAGDFCSEQTGNCLNGQCYCATDVDGSAACVDANSDECRSCAHDSDCPAGYACIEEPCCSGYNGVTTSCLRRC